MITSNKMKEIKEYSKEELWNNRKTGEKEPIPLMSPKQLAFKLRLLTGKVDDHKRQIDKLMRMRAIILNTIVKKGDKPKSKEDLGKEFVILNGTERKPIVVNEGTLEANGITVEECIKKDIIFILPDTSRLDDL